MIIEILLTGGAQIDAAGGEFNWTALHIAGVNGHRQIVKTPLDSGAQIAVCDSWSEHHSIFPPGLRAHSVS